MAFKELLILVVVIVGISDVIADGYGHGGHSYMVPTGDHGGGRKWSIRARGKGMHNMMQMHYPKHDDYKKEDKKEVVYYPVPVYEKHEEYKKEYPKKEEYHDYSKKKEYHMEYPNKEEYHHEYEKDEYEHDHHEHDYMGHESSHGYTIIPIYEVPREWLMNGAYGGGG